MREQDVVRVERRERVATVTLNRPHVGNALSSQLITELRDTLAALDEDTSVAAIVLTGAGEVFCAGLDLRELASPDGGNLALGDLGPEAPPSSPWRPLQTPLIGAVNGPAVTGGLEIALHCDILVASVTASFADTHARVGVLPGWGMSVLLPLAVGRGLARRMSLTGEFLTAPDALRSGLVTQVVPPSALLETAQQVAAGIADADPPTLGALLQLYREVESALVAEGPSRESRASAAWAAEDFDPAHVEQRRESVLRRNRAQQQRPNQKADG